MSVNALDTTISSLFRFAFEGSNGVLYLAAVLVMARAERSISAPQCVADVRPSPSSATLRAFSVPAGRRDACIQLAASISHRSPSICVKAFTG